MTLQQLRYFLALSEEQNFTRAATRCGITQPSLTRAVKELEAEFGGPLFVRSRSSSRLSRLGMILRPHFAIIEQAVAAPTQSVTRRTFCPADQLRCPSPP